MASTADLVVRVVTETDDSTSRLKKYASQFSSVGGAVKAAALPAAAALVALGAAAISATSAAADDAQAAALLAQNLKNSTGATQDQIAATETYIDKMAKATGVADDQLRPAMATLARGSGDVTQAQKDLAVALDVAAATGGDVESVSKAISKAYGGSTTSLKKLVPSMDAATLAGGDMSAIMADLAQQTGGSAAAAADTAAGKMARMKVAMGEAQEQIGAALLPAMAKLATMAATVAGAIQDHPRIFTAVAIAIGILAATIMIANVAMTIAAIAEAAMLWPILLIVAAIVALIVVVVLIIQHFDTLKGIAVAVWDAIKSAAQSAFDWVSNNWPLILGILTGPIGIAVVAIIKHWDQVKAGAQRAFDLVKLAWNTTVSAVKSAVSGLGDILAAPFNLVRAAVDLVSGAVEAMIKWVKKVVPPDAFAGPFNAAHDAAVDVKTAVDTMIGWVAKVIPPAAFSAPFDAAKTAIDAVIGAVQSLITWLGKIKVPSIHLPHIPGTSRTAPATAMPSVAGYAAPRGLGTSPGGRATTPAPIVINVTGAVDPEATARQLRRILAGHDRRTGLAT